MIVSEFTGKEECNSIDDLIRALNKRSENNSNDFELRTEKEYPFLTILVKEDYACVHYFKDENDCGHFAYTDDNKISEDYIVFNMGSESFETEISRDLIISVKQAYKVATDFFEKQEMSEAVKWGEL